MLFGSVINLKQIKKFKKQKFNSIWIAKNPRIQKQRFSGVYNAK